MSEENPQAAAKSDNATQVQQTQAQLEAIEKEIKETQALTSELMDIESLKMHYANDSSSKFFQLGVDALAKSYSQIRTIRGDGNCYYRAFLYSLCEKLLDKNQQEELSRILKLGTYRELETTSSGELLRLFSSLFSICLAQSKSL